jgi:putative tryptophan/tyrosine transport system substrate-binding protein
MKRREFITLLGGAAILRPLAAAAQQSERMRRIGVLVGLSPDDPDTKARLAGLRQGLERRGWSEGRNIRIDYHYAPADAGQEQALAKALVATRPDVIFAQSTPVTAAIGRETRNIPTVFVSVSDPVGSGFIASLARPGGNLTGLLLYEDGITGKWLAMLKEIAPNLGHAALLANPKTTAYDYFLRSAMATAPSLTIELVPGHVENAAEIEGVMRSIARIGDGGLVVVPDITGINHRDLIIALAARYRLPAVYHNRLFVAAGGLMSYGTDSVDTFRQAAAYIDRILRGDKPSDLPVQVPTKYETVLNLKTARMLGLTVPPGLLVAADEVIE